MFEEVDKGPKNSVGCAELLRSPIDFHELRDIRGKDIAIRGMPSAMLKDVSSGVVNRGPEVG